MINNFVSNFSINNLTNFFKRSVSSFKPEKDNLDYLIEDKYYPDFSELTKLGSAAFKNSDNLIVFACKYDGELTAKTSRKKQFDIAKMVLKEDFKDGAIFVFYDESKKFRFSFIRKNVGEKGDKRYTPWKRYTYFVQPEATNKTFKSRIGDCTFKDLDSVQKAFSVEELTKQFYNELFQWYQWALAPETGITYPNNTATEADDRVKLEEQIIRLITRLLFVWFIKQKQLVPDKLFNKNELNKILKGFDPVSMTNGDYYNAILQNLFFATLNKAVTEREFAKLADKRDIKTRYRYAEMFNISEKEILDLFRPIPFLNGGLFECLDKEKSTDGIKYHLDGFSRNDEKSPNGNLKYRAFIPNCIFFDEEKGLIPLLERYNFTVEENAPNEIQVALDPELLGNVFENLLGAFNPETHESARKQSGSFYTPKEIVDCMVDESLKAYLQQHLTELKEETLTELFEQDPLPEILAKDMQLCSKVAKMLRKVKILDPACGSGAFPMGILNRMVAVLEKLEVKNKTSHHELKLHLIQECIYGVDIQTIAAQISKLRFFISLIVEQQPMDLTKPEENYGVATLPNLETKFVAANTLIGMQQKPVQLTIFDKEDIDITKQELLEIRKKHFYAKSASAKKKLREQDAELREKLSSLLGESGEYAPEDALQFAQWNPYDQNASSPFFDPEWMFGEETGFDVIIGNPPYVQLQKESGRLAKMFQKCGYKTFEKTGDIYSLFYERGWQLLKSKGFLCYITSNKWMRAGYGESTRRFFAENTNPLILIDFAGQKIFESATVDTNILLFSKDKNRQQTKACVVKEKVLNNLSVYFRQMANFSAFSGDQSWVILNSIEQSIKAKIEAVGTPLKNWDINIYRGILTGYNEAFIISGAKKQEILDNCRTSEERKKTDELIRPILRGRDIKRYGYDFDNKYLIATFPSRKYNIDDFPSVKSFLEGFKPKLKQTGETLTEQEKKQVLAHANANGISVKENDLKTSRKKTNNKWFETQDSISYWDDFSKQKIVWKRVGSILRFSYDETGKMALDSTCFATGKHIKLLVAILNSKMGHYLMKDAPKTGTGDLLISVQAIEPLKIPVSDADIENFIDNIIDNILETQNVILEGQLDKIVYEMYKLNEEEICFIQSQ